MRRVPQALADLSRNTRVINAAIGDLERRADDPSQTALLLKPDGSDAIRARRTGPAADAAIIGAVLGAELRGWAGADYGLLHPTL